MAATKTRPWLRNPRRYSTKVGGGAVESRVDLRIPDVTTTAPISPKPRRPWLQFRLRTMLVIVLVFGCGMGWFAYKLKQARRQRTKRNLAHCRETSCRTIRGVPWRPR